MLATCLIRLTLHGGTRGEAPREWVIRRPRLPWRELWPLELAAGHDQLLPEQGVFKNQRPPTPGEVANYQEWHKRRLDGRPGMTGLWQVMRLRDQEQSDFQEWIYYDTEYARHRSLWLDWQIILYTPISILAPRWVKDLARQLKKRGICTHSAHLERSWPTP